MSNLEIYKSFYNTDFAVAGLNALELHNYKNTDKNKNEIYEKLIENRNLSEIMNDIDWGLNVLKFRLAMLRLNPCVCDELKGYVHKCYEEILNLSGDDTKIKALFTLNAKVLNGEIIIGFMASFKDFFRAKSIHKKVRYLYGNKRNELIFELHKKLFNSAVSIHSLSGYLTFSDDDYKKGIMMAYDNCGVDEFKKCFHKDRTVILTSGLEEIIFD